MIVLRLCPEPEDMTDASRYWAPWRVIDLDSSKPLAWLTLAHELGHARLDQFRTPRLLETHADEIAAWLYAFVLQGSREHIEYAARCLSTYDVVQPLGLLHEGCNKLGVPLGGQAAS